MRVRLTIGDWRGLGHFTHEEFVMESNMTVLMIQYAYKKSCKLTGISFNKNENFTDIDIDSEPNRMIAVDYDDSYISDLAFEILKNHGLNLSCLGSSEDLQQILGAYHFLCIWIEFVK